MPSQFQILPDILARKIMQNLSKSMITNADRFGSFTHIAYKVYVYTAESIYNRVWIMGYQNFYFIIV